LTGLGDDDHVLYFNVDGSDAMTGDLDLGSNDIINATIDGDLNTLQDIAWTSLKERNKTYLLIPEYNNMMIYEDGTSNIATMSQGEDSVNDHQYFVLSSAKSSLQDLDIILRIQLPNDFTGWQATPIQIYLKTATTNTADNQIDVSMFDTANTSVSLTGASDLHSTTADTWIENSITFGGAPTWLAGDFVTIKLKLQACSNNKAYVSEIKLNYKAR